MSLSWALGALASVLLCLGHLWFGLIAYLGSFGSGGPWWAFAFPAILLAQAGLCLARAAGWLQGRPLILAAAVAVLTVAHAAVATVAWPNYSPYLWILWIGPVPMLIPALIQFAAGAIRRTHSP
ncbi:MAG: hypothetical protein M3P18_14480 [Actinomycetota bacterium]|nr:hypothetical protein [Actinomycetota bacterium]